MRKIISLLCCLCLAYTAKAQYPPHPVVSDGETEVNNGLFDEDEGCIEDEIPVYKSIWN